VATAKEDDDMEFKNTPPPLRDTAAASSDAPDALTVVCDEAPSTGATAQAQQRFTHTGRKVCAVIDVCIALACTGMVVGLASALWLALAQSGIAAASWPALNAYLAASGLPLSAHTPGPLIVLIATLGVIYVAVVLAVLGNARAFLKQTLGTLTPFAHNQAVRLRWLAALCLALAVAMAGFFAVAFATGLSAVHLAVFMLPVENLVIAMLFYFLAYVCDYGALLQQLADETL
jgi:hypothetical protein